jgi:hypothetical protein
MVEHRPVHRTIFVVDVEGFGDPRRTNRHQVAVPKSLLIESLPSALVANLQAHNAAHPRQEQIRPRMSLHAGEINYDEHGVTATSINLAFRLIEAERLKAALDGSSGVLAIIVSSWFYEEVVRHSAIEMTRESSSRTGAIYAPSITSFRIRGSAKSR